MPRYLTPAKLCLLLLIDLYTSDEIPASSKLDVLAFIASQINPPSDHDNAGLEERFALASADISVFASKLSKYQSGIPGRSLHDALLNRIWKLEDLDSLHGLFQQLGELVTPQHSEEGQEVPAKVSRSSPLGQFLRRSCVEFTRLQFSDSQALWTAFSNYRRSSYETWSSRNPHDASQLQLSQLVWSHPPSNQSTRTAHTSIEDTSTLLSYSIYQLQKLGTRLPSSTKAHLKTWISSHVDSTSNSNPSSASAKSLEHFLLFFEAWRSGQYTTALESLHRYFDYSLSSTANPSDANGGGAGVKQYYQYALLHLSVLHADFEAWEESVDAMDECIATARENQDVGCLNFALSWLLYLRQAHPFPDGEAGFGNLARLVGGGNSEGDALQFLKQKAKEGRGWSLLASTLLEEGKGEMYSAGSSPKAFEHILQASYLNIQHDLRTLLPASTLFHGASYDRLGQSALSQQIYSSINTLHKPHCPINDRVRSTCRVAYNLAQSGSYTPALSPLDSTTDSAKGVLKLQQRLQAFKLLIHLLRSLRRKNLPACEAFLEQLAPIRRFGDPEIVFEISLLEIEVLIKQEDYSTALSLVNRHINTLKSKPSADLAQHLHLLVLKARIFTASGNAIKGFSIVLRAAAMAERCLLLSVLTEAMSVLGGILNALSEFEAAKEVFEAVLPSALENTDGSVAAELFAQLGEAFVGLATTSRLGSGDQGRFLRLAEANYERSFTAYQRIEDQEGMLEATLALARLAGFKGEQEEVKATEGRYERILKALKEGMEAG